MKEGVTDDDRAVGRSYRDAPEIDGRKEVSPVKEGECRMIWKLNL